MGRSDSRRTLTINRGAALRGRVVLADGVTPVANAQVHITEPGVVAELVTPWTFGKPIWTTTDETGAFEFRGLTPGRRAAHGMVNAWISNTIDSLDLEEGKDREVVLVMPAVGRLRGKLLLPDSAPLRELTLRLVPDEYPTLRVHEMDRHIELELRADGTFESGLLPVGGAVLWLRAPAVEIPYGSGSQTELHGPELKAAHVAIEQARVTEAEVDLRETWYGSLRVQVTQKGAPMKGIVVIASRPDSKFGSSRGGVTDEGGVATIPYLTSGEWVVTARPVEATWYATMPGTVLVASRSEGQCSLDVKLAHASVQLVDRADGTPLANFQVHIKSVKNNQMRLYTTDDEGQLSLELTPGSYEFIQWGATPPNSMQLEWTESGPATSTVELDRRE